MFTFKKEERLCRKTSIDNLFKNGQDFFAYPLKVIWEQCEEEREFPVQVLISVSKRYFKKAVDRNYIKRIIREAYRKNKNLLYDDLLAKQKKINFAILYTAKEIISYEELERKIIHLLKRLIEEHDKNIN